MSIYSQYRMSTERERDGYPLSVRQGDDPPATLYIARSGGSNAKYLAAVAKHLAGKIVDGKPVVDIKEIEDATVEIFADSVLVGWDNLIGEDGKQIKYSREQAIKLMKDLPELYDEINKVSSDAQKYRAALVDSLKKK